MAERFMFFTSVGFCLAVALAIEKWILKSDTADLASIKKPVVLAMIIPIAIVYAAIVIDRNKDWFDNYTLFKADINKRPNDCRLSYYLGTEIATTKAGEAKDPAEQKKLTKEGIDLLYKSLAVYPDYDNAQASIGNAYFHIQQYDSAEFHEKRALELNPKDAITINNLAGVYFSSGKYPLAIKLCHDALDLNPHYVNAYSNIGLCYLHMGKLDSSLINLYKAVSIDPNFSGSYDNLALTYKAMGQMDSVKKYEARAKQKPF
jgi:tetratricopeptide (TPR) repeat protein